MNRRYLLSAFCFALLIQMVSAAPLSLSYKTIPENPMPGEFVLQLYVTNLGRDVTMVELFVSEREEGFAIIESGREVSHLYLNLGGISSGTAISELKLKAEKSGFYELGVVVRANGSDTIRNKIVLKVYDKPSFAALGSIETQPSDRENFSIILRNDGGKARDVRVYLKTPEGVSVEPSKFYFKEFGREERILNFTILTDSIKTGVYEILLEISFNDEFGNRVSDTIPLTLNVKGEPELAISLEKTDPDRIYPDMEFALTLTVENHGFEEAKNVELVLKLPEGFKGETEKLLGNLEENEAKQVSFALKSGDRTGTFPFEASLTYEHGGKKSISKSFNVFVSERGEISLDIAGVFTSPQSLGTGDRFKLSLQLENSGRQDAKAVSVHLILPEGLSGKKSYFIGSLESGDSATASFDLLATKSGEMKVKAIISYMDQKFSRYEEEKEFSLYVFEGGGWEIYGIAAAILVIGLGIAYAWRKKS
jgi:hypothetical protein